MKVLLMNAPILTAEGCFEYRRTTVDVCRRLIREDGFESAIGHDATARALGELLNAEVLVNRINATQQIGQTAIVLKVRGRLPEGQILDEAALNALGYDLFTMERIA